MGWRRRILKAAAALPATLLASPPSHAQAPGRNGRFLVGAAPGSQLDLVARLLAERMREPLGQNLIVDNRPGATGRIAIQQLRAAELDGTTVLIVPSGWLTTIPHMRKSVPYDPLADFTLLSKVCSFDFAIAVPAAIPARTLAEFVQWSKANPKLSSIAVPISGGTLELLAWMFGRAAKLDLPVVPYKGGGGGEFRSDLIAGRVPAAITLLTDFLPDHQSGRLRILATTGPERSTLLPDMPTCAEQGFGELVAREWFGVVGPAKMATEAETRLAQAIQAAARAPATQATFTRLGFETTVVSGARFREEIVAEHARWRAIVKAVDFQPID